MNKIKILLLILFCCLSFFFAVIFPPASLDILLNLRLSRAFQGFFTGFSLSLSAAVLQGVLKNPLADPFIIGVSGGAMLFLLIAKFLNISDIYFFPALGGLAASYFSYALAKRFSWASNSGILLAGIAVNAFITALITMFVIFRKDDLIYFFHFSFGNLSGVNHKEIFLFSVLAIVVFLFVFLRRKNFSAISFDEEKASTMGISSGKEKLLFFALASALASFSVGLSGLIGFAGLVAANAARMLFPFSTGLYLFSSSILGAMLILFADWIGRFSASPIEIPVGAITSFLGAPFFIWLLYKENKK
ncbi:MAG: iron ABC transporter permease [Elusimicrobia bacterium]|nr:iron ABC transporter permease [Elusimicrobiota bacterium]